MICNSRQYSLTHPREQGQNRGMAKRDDKGKFVTGESGNPGGRPARSIYGDVATLAREYTTDAVTTLAEIMGDVGAPPSARVAAANSILDRGYGKAPQRVELIEPDKLKSDELESVVRDIIMLRDRNDAETGDDVAH